MNRKCMKRKSAISTIILMLLVTSMIAACGKSSSNPSTDGGTNKAAEQGKDGANKKDLTTLQEIAMYEGVDRQQRLIEAAKKEGVLNLYTSMNQASADKIKADFEKKYGIKVNLWRASSEKVIQRTVTESQAGRFEVDVVETNGPEMEGIQREKLLQEVKSPHLKDLIPQAMFPHKEWVATRLNVFVQEYNTKKVKKEDLPKSYEDLLNPKWKGMLGVEGEDYDWFLTVVNGMGEEKGLKFFKDLVATNGISVRKGHALLAEMVVSGEVPFALTVYSYKAEQDKKAGAPVDWYSIGPAIVRPNGVGVTKKAPHPNAAVLFYDYMISDAQNLLTELDFVPVNKNANSPFKGQDVKFVDPKTVLEETSKWSKLFEEIIVNKK